MSSKKIGKSSSIEKKNRVLSATRTNASGLTEEADKVLVAHLTRENPGTLKLEQLVKSNSQVFSVYTKANNYDKIRNRFNYLKKIRLNEPHVFVSLCIGYSIEISQEKIASIFAKSFVISSPSPSKPSSPPSNSRAAFATPSPQASTRTESRPRSNNMSYNLVDSLDKKFASVQLEESKFLQKFIVEFHIKNNISNVVLFVFYR